MKVLLVEDDQNKLAQLREFIVTELKSVDLSVACSYTSALESINNQIFDLILLDMSMYTFDVKANESPGEFRHFAGKEILRKMRRRGITTPVIIITQFSTFGEGPGRMDLSSLCQELNAQYPTIYRGTVSYSAAFSNWQSDLYDLFYSVSGR